ncbi:golgin subfamily A member 2 isoform X1 [Eurytemora carolleeae]|uniref:golgin subfamily A member 2 isoform X1 n=1 Tax=Eurytemora carolleeae TaxID=1294199 RepID=UPI000C78E168|nr:golgin subfamily A member 2 isoform X1 [Eurytemora carolleeae]|eukprot:XP_023334913.1 golgin subfamily A member 2-like isoform X1 [Eurytemora affinis]
MQAERLSEQLRRHQDENARLVHRESGLVGQIEQMEKQMQKYVQGGKNVTEEENSALKDRCSALESEFRQSRELYNKLEEMYSERSAQVEDTLKRLSQREGKINELQGMVSRLETTNEMLRTDSGLERNKAELLASMESDKVAASRALQQNSKLKKEIEELQQELVNLINSKAELLDRLEDYKRQVEKLSSSDSQIKGLQESLRERDVAISSMKNQIKYLESVSQPGNSSPEYTTATVDTDLKQLELTLADLQRATEEIRGLHSINSELRSQLEVLSSRTRECSESRSPSSRTGQESRSRSPSSSSNSSDHGNSTLSVSSDSFIQVDKIKSSSSSPPSSDNSFLNLPKIASGDVTKSVDVANGNPAILSDQHGGKVSSPVDNLEAWRQLENRFISAMNTVASLSSDKDQLEHLVTRLQEETDTIADYIVMYQHQRKQQKMKIQVFFTQRSSWKDFDSIGDHWRDFIFTGGV